jgi:hypothetical protein
LFKCPRKAWSNWLEHQKKLVNENRLNLAAAKASDARGTCDTLPGKDATDLTLESDARILVERRSAAIRTVPSERFSILLTI